MAKPKVLIVEDNRDARQLLVMVLGRGDYEVIEAENGSEALHQASTQHPDLILMDLGLPGMTGDEVTARIRGDPCTAHIPIIVDTAFDPRAPIVKRAFDAGADQIIYKPLNFKILGQAIRRLIDRGHNAAEA